MSIKCEITGSEHRLRRYPHNRFSRTVGTMSSDSASSQSRFKSLFMAVIMLTVLTPQSNAEDVGATWELQAQNISATFDGVTETTKITWDNIESFTQDLQELQTAQYKIYRHDSLIDAVSLPQAELIGTVDACTDEVFTNCQGGQHAGHEFTYQVEPGTDDSFYYGITTLLQNGSVTKLLNIGASAIDQPVAEFSSQPLSPYHVRATYDRWSSSTELTWINYNDISNTLPTTGDDALIINVWRTEYQVTRTNGYDLISTSTPLVQLGSQVDSHTIVIPEDTNRESYYSVTYDLPNWTAPGSDYQDARFLTNNAMSTSVEEDNVPPNPVSTVSAEFEGQEESGRGNTTITWTDVEGETGESYRIYVSGIPFTSTNNSHVKLIATESEGVESFKYELPVGVLGEAYYCVVIVDRYGIYDSDLSASSCAGPIMEDAFNNWIAEPTNVFAEYIGNGKTLVTWDDQLGVEGEKYHIWYSGFRVTEEQWELNDTVTYVGSVADGIGRFIAEVPDGVLRLDSHYFVTSEALYGHVNGTYEYRGLVQNYYGPITEDTLAPDDPRLYEPEMSGDSGLIVMKWINDDEEVGETYDLWRNVGDPFDNGNISSVNISDDDWELVLADVDGGNQDTITRLIAVDADVERTVWYGLTITDRWNNTNVRVYPGIGGNAVEMVEDSRPPTMEFELNNKDDGLTALPSLTAGQYMIRVRTNEQMQSSPTLNITTSDGGTFTQGIAPMTFISHNDQDSSKGSLYYYELEIASNSPTGVLNIAVTLIDAAGNSITLELADWFIDSSKPTVQLFSPTSSGEGAKYLYGNKIDIIAGVEDDVTIDSIQYMFIHNYGDDDSFSETMKEVTEFTDLDGDGKRLSFMLQVSAGSFDAGQHEITVTAIDAAGNKGTDSVRFIVDYCRHNDVGETICKYEESLVVEEPVEKEKIGYSDPPYMISFALAGLNVITFIIVLLVIQVVLSSPKKKKDRDDEDDDDDWMSEFIGTSSEPDMDELTGGAPKEEEKKEQSSLDLEDEDDPFAVNEMQVKRRRKKSSDEDDDEDDDEEEDEKPRKVGRRKVGRRK